MSETEELYQGDEFGQIEAADIPTEDAEEAPDIEDENYDPANDELDPELMGEELGASGTELPAEGGDI